MFRKCIGFDRLLVVDEFEYFYKGKSYCDDCYRAVKKLEVGQEKEDPTQRFFRFNWGMGIRTIYFFVTNLKGTITKPTYV